MDGCTVRARWHSKDGRLGLVVFAWAGEEASFWQAGSKGDGNDHDSLRGFFVSFRFLFLSGLCTGFYRFFFFTSTVLFSLCFHLLFKGKWGFAALLYLLLSACWLLGLFIGQPGGQASKEWGLVNGWMDGMEWNGM